MMIKTTHRPDNQERFFYNTWVVTISLLVGVSVMTAAILIGWPVFIHLVAKLAA